MKKQRRAGNCGCPSDVLQAFFCSQQLQMSLASSHKQCLQHIAADYIGSKLDAYTVTIRAALDYWVTKMDQWTELIQYAIELLGFPAVVNF